ncbi:MULTISPECIES: DUF2922 domain-containing protein [unclassified Viridibacillus]|uniref:DUF2922 domain-containing protein n=1 Tax=unclassified Viridibacillus TaxID=2617942 RepID=UPI00096F4DBC|nr:DUF2922 domain-containing protein [Viridibacillus sp. FSL H8-0123]OMC84619.1 hypothetical protein BK130_03080 [Viridibacillus sp. FSL H8-0123]
MAKVLQLQFKTAGDKNYTLNVDAPKYSLTEQEISDAMVAIIDSAVFLVHGEPIATIKGAQIVDRQVTEYQVQA